MAFFAKVRFYAATVTIALLAFSDCYWGYMYAVMYEQIPTVIRQQLAGAFDSIGALGGVFAPFVPVLNLFNTYD